LQRVDGTDESLEQAARRCLRHEYGIVESRLTAAGSFSYFARDRDGLHCENEHCTLFVGEFNGTVQLNQDVGYSYRWVSKAFLLHDIATSPDSYSPWAILSVSV